MQESIIYINHVSLKLGGLEIGRLVHMEALEARRFAGLQLGCRVAGTFWECGRGSAYKLRQQNSELIQNRFHNSFSFAQFPPEH